VERTSVTTDEQATVRHKGAELREIEFSEIHDAICRRAKHLAGGRRDPRGRIPIRRSRAEHDAPRRRGRTEPGHERGEGRFRPSPEGIPRAHMHDDQFVLRRDAQGLQPLRDLRLCAGVRRHFDRVAGSVRPSRRPSVNCLEQVPLIYDRVTRA
jgi:hypothetical protein